MKAHARPLGGLIIGGLLALTVAGFAVAYSYQVAATVIVSAPSGPQYCGIPLKVTAQVQDKDGNLIADQLVIWTFLAGNGAGDIIDPTTSVTNASGIATTYVTLHCSPPHSVTVQAKADDATGTAVIETSGQGLPPTSTAPQEQSMPAVLLAAFAVLLGAGTILRRFAADRR